MRYVATEYGSPPVIRVTGYDTPFPYALEAEYLPGPARILAGIEQALDDELPS